MNYYRVAFSIVFIIFAIFIVLFMFLYFFRAFAHIELDDVNPLIECPEIYKADVLWVIPVFKGIPISENLSWCASILALNKSIGMHGVYHTFNEFNTSRDVYYVRYGSDVFKECFGFYPKMFKAPQLELSVENKRILKKEGFVIRGKLNQMLHRVYHCGDDKTYPNRYVDRF